MGEDEDKDDGEEEDEIGDGVGDAGARPGVGDGRAGLETCARPGATENRSMETARTYFMYNSPAR